MPYESLEQAKLFHNANSLNWSGEALAEYKHQIKALIDEKKPKSILDYGCGKALFHKHFLPTIFRGIMIFCYDPAVKDFENKPQKEIDLTLCIDVMEHVQEDKIDEVLKDLFTNTKFVFLTITCYDAIQKLPNGKNAHYTVKPPSWWNDKLKPYDGKYQVVFQEKRERSKIVRNPDPKD
tara:strand:- start:7558 stop:8094 length:537 start_codon:yes stop_codon:yes gene_type:complete